MYLLDSNAWIVHFRSKGNSTVSRRIAAERPGEIVTCSAVRAELMTGAIKSRNAVAEVDSTNAVIGSLVSYPFDDPAADGYARSRAGLERQGLKIGANDYIVAAVARVHGLTVVTHNTREFSRVPGLMWEDWQ